MRIYTVRDVGALVREARQRRGMTQADVAAAIGVSRDWVVRLEKGHPRLEAQLVLDALAAVGSTITVTFDDTFSAEPAEDAFSRLADDSADGGSEWLNRS